VSEIIHSKKLFDGRFTAEELHRTLAWGAATCNGCGSSKLAIRIQIFIRLIDMNPHERSTAELGIALREIKPVTFPDGNKAILYSRIHACDLCKPAAERAAAKAPSYSIVDISRGPGPDNALVSVAAAIV